MHIEDYVLAFQRGEESGFNFFFYQHHKALFLFSYHITKNKEVSEEIIEDVFIKLWAKHESFSHANTIKAYLFTCVKNASLNWLRQQKKETLATKQLAHLANENEENTLQKIIAAEVYTEIYSSLKSLPPKCRKIFTMLYVEGKDYQQIAHELQLSIDTIRNQKARGLALLKKQINFSNLSLLYFFLIFF